MYRGPDMMNQAMEQRMPRMSAQLRAISLEYSYKELADATKNWHASTRLGSGSYGAVFKGELEDGSEVAIKAIDLGALGAQGQCPEMAGFDDEVQMLSKFRHPNLVTLLGWGKHNLWRYLVYELLSGGDAFQRLQKSKSTAGAQSFFWHERISVCLDAATGLSHMHNSKPKAFHRDIKAANILMGRHGTAKMADFGLSCTTGRAGALHVTVKTISGTPGYACPIYSRTGRVTEGSEVYSFGMVMLELITCLAPASADRRVPGGIVYHIADHIAPNQPGAIERVMRNVDVTAGWPAPLVGELGNLALRCLSTPNEQHRPHFVEIVRGIRNMMERFPKTHQPVVQPQVQPTPQPVACPGHGQPCQQHPQMQHQGSAVSGHGGTYPGHCGGAAAHPGSASGHGGPVNAHHQVAGVPPHAGNQPQARPVEVVVSPAPPAGCVPATARANAPAQGPSAAGQAASQKAVDTSPPQQSTAGQTCFCIYLVGAAGVNVEELPVERRRLQLHGTLEGTVYTAQIGRQHQPELFEVWLPDLNLRNCVSRTAFEVSWGGGGANPRLIARGANPLSVDNVVVDKTSAIALRLGSQIAFTYTSSGEHNSFLTLKFATMGSQPPAAAPAAASAAAPVAAQIAAPGAAPPAAGPMVAQMSSRRSSISSVSSNVGYQASDMPADPSSGRTVLWRLICTLSEGLSEQGLFNLPSESRSFDVFEGKTLIGRQHQPQIFEALLVAAPNRLSLISRTHVQIEAQSGCRPLAMNMSSNPLYISRQSVPKGETKQLAEDQTVSFARLDGTSHVDFLVLRLVEVDADHNICSKASSAEIAASAPRISGGCDQVPAPQKAPSSNSRISVGNLPSTQERCAPMQPSSASRSSFSNDPRQLPPQVTAPADNAQPEATPIVGSMGGDRRSSSSGYPHEAQDARSSPAAAPSSVQPSARAASLSQDHAPAVCKVPTSTENIQPEATPSVGSTTGDRRPPNVASPDVQARPATNSNFLQPQTTEARSPGVTGVPEETPETQEAVDIVLELCGDGVNDVPLADRRIGPVTPGELPLTVGRRHQPELHRKAVTKACLQFLSRDHFKIAFERGGFRLQALTSNPIWRDRTGQAPVELTRGEVVDVALNDTIALGTGADGEGAACVEDARRRLCWTFRQATSSDYAKEEMMFESHNGGNGSGTPPSPGGIGPRVSNIMPPASAKPATFEPILPPAQQAIWNDRRASMPREERPSEVCGPAPRLLPAMDDVNAAYSRDPVPKAKAKVRGRASDVLPVVDEEDSAPQFGGHRVSAVLRAPVPLDGVLEDNAASEGGTLDITGREDEFAKSGFRF